jgi:orotate phosphoribosyltransferase-like protein
MVLSQDCKLAAVRAQPVVVEKRICQFRVVNPAVVQVDMEWKIIGISPSRVELVSERLHHMLQEVL